MKFGNSAFWRSQLSRAARGRRPYALLSALCCLLYLPGLLALPLNDHSEAGFLNSARETGAARPAVGAHLPPPVPENAPKFMCWHLLPVFALSAEPQTQLRLARLPSFLCAVLAVLLCLYLGRTFFTPEKGLLAGLLLAACPATILAAQQATPSAPALLATSLALTLLAIICKRNSRGITQPELHLVCIFWLAVAGGLFLGGLLPGLAVLGAVLAIGFKDGNLANLRGLVCAWGGALTLTLLLLWLALLRQLALPALAGIHGWTNILPAALLPEDIAFSSLPGTGIIALPLLLWPALFYLVPALLLAWRRRTRQTLFLLGSAVLPLLLGALLPSHALPLLLACFPALCLLCAEFILTPEQASPRPALRLGLWLFYVCAALLPLVAFVALALIIGEAGQTAPLIAYLLIALALTACGCFFVLVLNGARLRLALLSLLLCILCAPLCAGVLLPGLPWLWPGLTGWEAAERSANGGRLSLLVGGGPALGLQFYSGGRTQIVTEPRLAAEAFYFEPELLGLVCQSFHTETAHIARQQGLELQELEQITYLHLLRREFIVRHLLRAKPQIPQSPAVPYKIPYYYQYEEESLREREEDWQ